MSQVPWRKIARNIKQIENCYDGNLSPIYPIVIRLDGVSFKKFTQPLCSPFDIRFTHTMIRTACDLIGHFNALIGYSISDEITLVLPPAEYPEHFTGTSNGDAISQNEMATLISNEQGYDEKLIGKYDLYLYKYLMELDKHTVIHKNRNHIYNGRISKLCSIASSYATARFNYHFQNNYHELTSDDSMAKTNIGRDHLGFFDGRAFNVKHALDVLTILKWRQMYDGNRNVVNKLGTHYFGHNAIHNMNRSDVLRKLYKEFALKVPGADFSGTRDVGELTQSSLKVENEWKDNQLVKPEISLGVFIKKQKISVIGHDKLNDRAVEVQRSQVKAKTLSLDSIKCKDDALSLIFSKYWN